MRITIRLSREDGNKLEEITDQHGMTISDLIRDLIRNGYERQTLTEALRDIRAIAGGMAANKGMTGKSEDIAEILRIVTLIARAMPSVAKHVS
ncbi:MAG: ribbon-helix-helix protein, CopG family [Nitrospirota bacterium]